MVLRLMSMLRSVSDDVEDSVEVRLTHNEDGDDIYQSQSRNTLWLGLWPITMGRLYIHVRVSV